MVSRFVADEVMRCLRAPASKIEVTPLGVRREFFGEVKASPESKAGIVCKSEDLGAQQGAVLARYGITSPFVLGVGTLEPRKNLRTLLEAFALLPSRLANQFQLVLAGKPGWGTANLERYLQNYAKRSSLVLTGYVAEDGLAGFVCLSQDVCFPIVL